MSTIERVKVLEATLALIRVTLDDKTAPMVRMNEIRGYIDGALKAKKPLEGWRIDCRRFFSSNGNTYHSVRIFNDKNTKEISVANAYGSGDQCIQTAIDVLYAHKYLDEATTPKGRGTLFLTEVLGIDYDVVDVKKRRDL